MKQFIYLCLSAILLLSYGCKKESVADNILNYDGENFSGPELEAGYHELAARYTSNMTARYNGRQLVAVQYFMGTKPQNVLVKVYEEGLPNFPGNLLYSADVTDEVRTLQWNEHTISTPIDIEGEDLWVAIAVTHAAKQQSLGCDQGNNYSGDGDWLYHDSDGLWQTFNERTGQRERVNWNVRGRVSEE